MAAQNIAHRSVPVPVDQTSGSFFVSGSGRIMWRTLTGGLHQAQKCRASNLQFALAWEVQQKCGSRVIAFMMWVHYSFKQPLRPAMA